MEKEVILERGQKMFCSNCGAEIEDGSIFCTSCGKKIDSEKSIGEYKEEVIENCDKGITATKNHLSIRGIIISIIILDIAFILIICTTIWGIRNKHSSTNLHDSELSEETLSEDFERKYADKEKVIEEVVEDALEEKESKKSTFSNYEFKDMNLAKGCTLNLSSLYPDDSLKFEIDNTNVIDFTVGNMIVAKSDGRANITVSNEKTSDSFEICVTNPQLSTTEVTKIVGNAVSLTLLGTTSEAEWTSDNEAIATVENGVVYAEPTGPGMSTNIHALVDGMDLVCKVNVEPVPQLDTAYMLYDMGYVDRIKEQYNFYAKACSNTNKVINFTQEQMDSFTSYEDAFPSSEEVLNLNKVDYSNGCTFPVYEIYEKGSANEYGTSHIEIYLVGTSQDARVMTKCAKGWDIETSYEPQEGYGIITVWAKTISTRWHDDNVGLVYVEVDGLEYSFNIQNRRGESIFQPDRVPNSDRLVEFMSDKEETIINEECSDITDNSYTFISSELVEEMGEKFVDALQDKAVEVCVDLLFAAVFHI